MINLVLVSSLTFLMIVGNHRQHFGRAESVILVLVTIMQIALIIVSLYTMEVPDAIH